MVETIPIAQTVPVVDGRSTLYLRQNHTVLWFHPHYYFSPYIPFTCSHSLRLGSRRTKYALPSMLFLGLFSHHLPQHPTQVRRSRSRRRTLSPASRPSRNICLRFHVPVLVVAGTFRLKFLAHLITLSLVLLERHSRNHLSVLVRSWSDLKTRRTHPRRRPFLHQLRQ